MAHLRTRQDALPMSDTVMNTTTVGFMWARQQAIRRDFLFIYNIHTYATHTHIHTYIHIYIIFARITICLFFNDFSNRHCRSCSKLQGHSLLGKERPRFLELKLWPWAWVWWLFCTSLESVGHETQVYIYILKKNRDFKGAKYVLNRHDLRWWNLNFGITVSSCPGCRCQRFP